MLWGVDGVGVFVNVGGASCAAVGLCMSVVDGGGGSGVGDVDMVRVSVLVLVLVLVSVVVLAILLSFLPARAHSLNIYRCEER